MAAPMLARVTDLVTFHLEKGEQPQVRVYE